MSLITRKPVSIGRAQRIQRDDRCFVVATDDTDAPKQYFDALAFPRVKILVLETLRDSGMSAPVHVVRRIKDAFERCKNAGEVQADDEFWVLLDTDHHLKPNHIDGTRDAVRTATQAGVNIAFSNPCFELWLLLHHADVPRGTVFKNYEALKPELEKAVGKYDKTALRSGHFPQTRIPDAIRRARVLETSPDSPNGYWPESTGTRIYRLFERILSTK